MTSLATRQARAAARTETLRKRSSLSRGLFLLPAGVYLLLVFVYPLCFNLWLTFQKFDLRSLVSGASEFIGWENFRTAFSSPTFAVASLNTVVFTVVSVALQYAIGLALALFFNRAFPLGRTLRALLVLPWLIPGVVATTAWRFVLQDPVGFLNQALAVAGVPPVHWLTSPATVLASVILINIWLGIAFNLVLLYSGLQGVPRDRLEAAQVDGAGAWQRFRFIVLPALRPVSGIVLVLGIIYTLKQFDLVWTLTQGGPGNASQLLSTWIFALAFQSNDYGQAAAVSDVLFCVSALTIVVYGFLRKGA